MGHWLAPVGAARTPGHVKRFDARFWTVDFPRPMMASVVTTGPNALRAEALFYRADDLAGLIWEARDRWDHVLHAYEEARDFRRCRLAFRWRSSGVKPLDAVHGPTLTIEGRDAEGAARSWYVRLWNYAEGTAEDAAIALDFGALAGGWEADDPVWAGDVERMFVSLVAAGYDASDAPLPAPAEGWAEMSEIVCEGSGSVLTISEGQVPGHGLRIATGYDDLYQLTPARMLRSILLLGYRDLINHYVGMSHYFRLDGDLLAAGALNGPCAAWHADFLARAKALGFEVILSLSYELLALHCPEGWQQRAANGDPARTAWEPPSALLSPANGEAMAWLQGIARGFAALAVAAGQRVRFQIGEPWWWVMPDRRICLYDAAAVAAFDPAPIADVGAALDPAQLASLDAAGAALAASTAALCAAVRDEAADAECLLLLYLPTLLGAAEIVRANAPPGWAAPAFDVLQLEDYGWVTQGRSAAGAGAEAMAARLGYPVAEQHYLAGFVERPEDKALWARVAAAADAAVARNSAETFVWALPQVVRDGFVHFALGEGQMDAFDEVRFPVALGREARVEPAFSTAIVATAGGAEQRNAEWADARLTFDAGPGVRSEADLLEMLAFFRARRGAAVGFRLEDPFDNSSNGMILAPGAADQLLGVGDGVRTEFPLVKTYGQQVRRITRPVAGTVRVSVGGAALAEGWTLGEKGLVLLDDAPAEGAEVKAGFRFDVPVRFAEDRLSLNRATFLAGEIPSVPMIEIRE